MSDERKPVVSYTDDERRLAVAAVRRYGLRPAERLLGEAWERSPSQPTLIAWSRQPAFAPTEVEVEFWRKVEDGRKASLQAELSTLVAPAADAFRDFVQNREAGKAQQMAISLGILYDKLVPGPKMAGGGAVQIGSAGEVHLHVIPPQQRERRAIDVEVREAE